MEFTTRLNSSCYISDFRFPSPMHRFYLPRDHGHDSVLTLTGREAHHGSHVLRVKPGEMVGVLDGEGHRYLCEAESISKDAIRLKVLEKKFIEPLPYRITLVQAIPKGKLFDAIVQKATELGVFRIVPLLSERVVTQLEDGKSEVKAGHWRTVAIEAIKQCGSPWLPQVEAPVSVRDLVARAEPFDLPFVASLQADSRHPREWLKIFQRTRQQKPASLCVWVGPEGDFTPGEIDAAKSVGAQPITLGPLVLRSETAAIYCLSVLNYEFQSTVP
jgi:16S rRNA (uracil1498-N3)-methyltransferase